MAKQKFGAIQFTPVNLVPVDGAELEGVRHKLFFDPIPTEIAKEPEKERSWTQAAGDTVLDAVKSTLVVPSTIGGIYGYASGNADNYLSKNSERARGILEDAQSDVLKQDRKNRQAKIDKADGVVDELTTAFGETVSNPRLATSMAAENLGSLVTIGGIGAAAKLAAAGRGLTGAAKIGTRTAVGAGAVMQGADVANDVYKSSMDKPDTAWAQNPDFVAAVAKTDGSQEAIKAVKHDLSLSAMRMALPIAAGASVLMNKMPGGNAIERALVGDVVKSAGKGGVMAGVKAGSKAVAGETFSEAGEEGFGALGGNYAKQTFVDPNQNLMEKVGANTGLGAAGGFLMGGPAGVVHGYEASKGDGSGNEGLPLIGTQNQLKPVQEAAQQPNSVLSRAALAGNSPLVSGNTPNVIPSVSGNAPTASLENTQSQSQNDVKNPIDGNKAAQSIESGNTPSVSGNTPLVTPKVTPLQNNSAGTAALNQAGAVSTEDYSEAWNDDDIPLNASDYDQSKNNDVDENGLTEYQRETIADRENKTVDELFAQLTEAQKTDLQHLVDIAKDDDKYAQEEAAILAHSQPYLYSHFPKLLDARLKAEKQAVEQPPVIPATVAESAEKVAEKNGTEVSTQPVATEPPRATFDLSTAGMGLGGAVQYGKSAQSSATPANQVDSVDTSTGTPAPNAVVENAATENAQGKTTEQERNDAYSIRNAARLEKMRNAKTLEEAQALVDEENSDSDRHFEGTSAIERALGDWKRGKKQSDAQAQISSDYNAGKWVDFENGDADYAASLQKADPDHEYKSTGTIGERVIQRRKRLPEADLASPIAQPIQPQGVENGNQTIETVQAEAQGQKAAAATSVTQAKATETAESSTGVQQSEDQGSVTASESNAPAAQPEVDEPHWEDALKLQQEQVAATNNAAQTGKVRVRVRALAKKVQDGTKTALLLDTIATRLDMGDGKVKGIEFAPAPQEAKDTKPKDGNEAAANIQNGNATRELTSFIHDERNALSKAEKTASWRNSFASIHAEVIAAGDISRSDYEKLADLVYRGGITAKRAMEMIDSAVAADVLDAAVAANMKRKIQPKVDAPVIPSDRPMTLLEARNALIELNTQIENQGRFADDRLLSKQRQLQDLIKARKLSEQSESKLVQDFVDGKTKEPPSVDAVKAEMDAKKSDPLDAEAKAAFDEMMGGLADIASIATKHLRANWTAEQEAALMPAIVKVFSGAIRLGHVSFKKAVMFAREQIAKYIDQETADSIPFGVMQGAYIAVSQRYKDKPITSLMEVAQFQSIEDVLREDAKQPEPDAKAEQSDLPEGWSEAKAGGMATNQDPENGGIVDVALVNTPEGIKEGKWFAIHNKHGKIKDDLDTRADAIAAIANYVPEQKPESSTQDIAKVQHTTAKGKVLTGVIRTDITLDQAKTVDKYAFKKNGGVFVREEHLDALNEAFPAAKPTSTESDGKPSLANPAGRLAVSKAVADHLLGDNNFPTIVQARKFIENLTGERIEAGDPLSKRADEAIELGVVIAARDIVNAARKAGRSNEVIFDRLLGLYKNQPSLNVRDSDSLRNQAYSTPVPMAFVASVLAKVNADKLVGEPTAGNGALMMEANPATSVVNEFEQNRIEALKSTGFNPTNNDAATMEFAPKSLDSMVMNPPFGPLNGQKWTFGNFTTGEIDHAIVMNSLQALKDDGNGVLIIGGSMARNSDEQTHKDAYRAKAKREFFANLYAQYNVVDHFSVNGDLYKKQGAGFPVDVLVIRGRGKAQRPLPAAQLPENIDTWEQLKEKLNEQSSVESIKQSAIGGDRGQRGAETGSGAVSLDTSGSSDRNGTRESVGSERSIGNSDGSGSAESATQQVGASGQANNLAQRGNDNAPAPSGDTGGASAKSGNSEQRGNGSWPKFKPSGLGNGSSAAIARSNGQRNGRLLSEPKVGDEDNRLQVPYENISSNKPVNTLVATNHLGAIKNAFMRLIGRVGNIDDYVRNELQYDPELFKASFSAEQVEALALAIDNVKKGKGFIIGDQTGIGKGRVVAAMIRYAKINGKTPVFVTQMPDLYGDMMRDLNDIGMGNTKPVMTNNNASVPLDSEALNWFSEKQAIQTQIAELQDAIESVAIEDLGSALNGMTAEEKERAIKNEVKKSKNPEIDSLVKEIAELRSTIPERRGNFLDTPAIEQHEADLAAMVAANSIGDNDVIFTTYTQIAALNSGEPKTVNGQKTPRTEPTFGYRNTFLNHFVNKDAMLILDESHNAGASDPKIATKLGNLVRNLIDQSGSVFYSSATFAKNMNVMDAYNKTDLGDAFPRSIDILNTIKTVPLQQAASSMLVEAGQYLRRERSFEGIDYENKEVKVSKEDTEDLATAMRLMVAFDEAKQGAINDIQNELDREGAAISALDGGGSQASVDSVNFTSVMHNVVNTFLLALKADATAQTAISAIEKGEKPVITVANTMEMFITEYARDNGIGIGDKLNATYADVLRKYLDNTRYAKVTSPNGSTERVYLTDEQLGFDGVDAYNDALDFIDSLNFDVPISPIDHVKSRIEEAGYSIGEITGRQTVVVNGVLRQRNKAEQKTAGKKNTIAKFNNGGLDALIINRSGSTGLSMHASEKFEDQRRRVMVIGQAELDINNHMQMLGRINRTGQVTDGPFDDDAPERKSSFAARARAVIARTRRIALLKEQAIADFLGGKISPELAARSAKKSKMDFNLANRPIAPTAYTGKQRYYKGKPASYGLPHYYQMTADVPIEMRPAAVLANKMAALNANTTAGRKSAVQSSSLDFMNKYGDRVAAEVLMNNSELNEKLGSPLRITEDGEISFDNLIAKVTGRVGLLPLKDQSELYDILSSEYGELITQLDAIGQNDLEAKTYPLDAKTISSTVVMPEEGSSPFTSAVVAEEVDVKKLGKPHPKAKVLEMLNATLNGVSHEDFYKAQLREYEIQFDSEKDDLYAIKNDPTNSAVVRAGADIKLSKLDSARTRFRDILPKVGNTYVLKTDAGNIYGAVTDVFRSKAKASAAALSAWKIRIAVVDGAKTMTLPMSQVFKDESSKMPDNAIIMQKASDMMMPNADRTGFDEVRIVDAFDRGQTGAREKRVIMTGNVLRAASANLGGRLINYTDEAGNVKQGLMLPVTSKIDDVSSKFAPTLKNAQSILNVLNNDGSVWDKETGGQTINIFKDRSRYLIRMPVTGKGKKIAKDFQGFNFTNGRAFVWEESDVVEFVDFVMKGGYGIQFVPDKVTSERMKKEATEAKNVRFSRAKVADKTDTPQFKQWFGNSKVVDENGKPLVVYHGTILHKGQGGIGDITAFDRLFTTKIRGASIDTVGSWFSTNSGDGGAEMYSGNSSGSAIYPVHLSIQNPHVTTFQQMERHARKLANGKDDGRRIGKTEVDAYRNWLKSMGKDGIKIEASGNEGSTEFDNQVAWIALEPTQVKSSVGNNGNFDATNSDIRMSRGNFFYSALSKGIEGMATKQAMAGAWAMQLQGLVKKGAVKQAEIEWSGVTDWLKLQEAKVTKQQILNYLDSNGVQVKDVTLKDTFSIADELNKKLEGTGFRAEQDPYDDEQLEYFDINDDGYEFDELPNEVQQIINAQSKTTPSPTKYAKYTLQGGENYREVLLTLPIKQADGVPEGYRLIDIAEEDRADGFDIPAEETGPWRFEGPSVSSKIYKTRQEAIEALQKEIKSDQSAGILTGRYKYRSKHWDQPNVLAHIRMNDRIDADGNKVLFVEELQSDWGQQGKKKGFQGVIPSNVLEAAIKGGMDEAQARSDISALLENPISTGTRDTSPMWGRLYAATNGSGIDLNEEFHDKRADKTPIAPFVTTTDGWLNLGLKAIIKMAVDGGYDKVAFVNGEQSAKRYDLSNRVDSILAHENPDGSYYIQAEKDGSYVFDDASVQERKLEGIVGKELAQRIVDGGGSEVMRDGAPFKEYKGVDLEVGGEGMKAFYDKIVPNTVNALLKKVGGEGAQSVRGLSLATYSELVKAGQRTGKSQAELDAMPALDRKALVDAQLPQQLGFTITDAMRKQASGGLPLFSKAGKASGMPLVQVREIVDVIRSQWGNAPDMVVAANMNDPIIPQAVRDADKRQQSQGAIGNVEGFVYGGKVYVVASELNTPTDVLRVLFHESLGHLGLRGVFGKSLEQVLNQVILGRRKEVIAKAISYGLDPSNNDDLLQAAEEVLAEMAQSRPELGFVQRAIAAIRNFLRANVPFFADLELTDADIIQGFILPARRFVENGGGGGGGKGKTAFSLKERLAPNGKPSKLNAKQYAEVRTPQFKAWFGDSKAVDENGEPMVVYHGTNSVFKLNSFRPTNAELGTGIYTTDDKSWANEFGDRVLALNASIKNPLYIYGPYGEEIDGNGKPFDPKNIDPKYDGIIHQQSESAPKEIVVFDAKQFRLANEANVADNNPDIRFSRGAIANAKDSIAAARELNIGLGYKLGDMFKSTAKTSWWNRTVGTQYHLAEKSPEFKRTFDAVQNFLSDTSTFANKAADLAPNMLPKLETLKDLTKRALSADDMQSASEAIFEGTLNWARDGAGNLVKYEDMLEAANQMTAEDKARQLLRANKMHPKALQMWQGLPLDEYEAIINSKYERDMLQAGVVFTPSELKSIFLLTGDLQQDGSYSGQIGLYQEFRKSTNQSLKDLATSEMVRLGADDLRPIADVVMDASSVDEAHGVIQQYLESMAEANPDRAEELQSTIDSTRDIADKAINLMRNGYAPLSRFGKYAVYATSPAGEQLYFGMYETQREANKAERGLRDALPDAVIQSGVMSQEQHKLFEGVSPETLAIFGESMGLDAEKGALYQEYIKLVASSRSSMRRMLKRKGVDGYSEDATRVLAGFVSSNARKVASNLNKYEIEQSANKIKAGDVKDAAIKLKEYVQNPMEEAQWIRGMLFTQYIGGSVASAIINMTQPLTMTMPYLSQFVGINAPKRIAQAMKMAATGINGDDDLAKALKRAEDDGTVSPQEIHQLQAHAMGRGALKTGDGTATGDALALGNNALSMFGLAWGRLFGAAEEFNRRATFIAAYKIARENPKLGNAFEFAEKAIKETQGIYNKGNKPAWARGAIGGVLFTFKQYSISYVEFLTRMYGNGDEGKKAVFLALGVLVLTAGINGLPAGDDLDDLIDGVLQSFGYNFSSKQAKQEFLTNALGSPAAAQFLLRGVTGLPGAPIDVSGRMGLGNLIPATGLLTRKDDHTRDVIELLGPIADLATRAYESGGMALKGDIGKAALNLTPVAARNVAQAVDMGTTGMYRDKLGRKVTDADMTDAAVKSIGFQPAHVAQLQQATMVTQKMIANARLVESEIARDFALGRFERNQSKMDAARQRLIDWNRKNPHSPIRVTVQQVNKLVQNMNKTKAQRMSATAPKEIRAAIQRELAGY